MTKKEILDSIIYDLKMKNTCDFEVDEESYSASKLNPNGYVIENEFRYIECNNLTNVRKEISKLGKKVVWL